RSRAAWPFVAIVDLNGLAVVIGIVESRSVREYRCCSGNCVVEHTLHAVAVTRVTRNSQQVTCDLEMAISSARCLKARMRGSQALVQQSVARDNDRLVWAPSASRVALLVDKPHAVTGRPQILFIAQYQIRLHGRTERIHVTVGMLSWQDILPFCQRPEIIF